MYGKRVSLTEEGVMGPQLCPGASEGRDERHRFPVTMAN